MTELSRTPGADTGTEDDALSQHPELNAIFTSDAPTTFPASADVPTTQPGLAPIEPPTPEPQGDPLSQHPELDAIFSSDDDAPNHKPMVNAVRGKIGDGQGEVIDIARRRGLPPSMVDDHLEMLRDADRDEALSGAPRTSKFLEQEAHARLAADDVTALIKLETALLSAPKPVADARRAARALSGLEESMSGNTLGAKLARAPITAVRKGLDLGVSGYLGAQRGVGSTLEGFGDLTYALGTAANTGVAKVFPAADKYLFLREDSPAWVARMDSAGNDIFDEAIGGAGRDVNEQADALDIPAERKGFDTQVAEGLGNLGFQAGVGVATLGAASAPVLMSQGANQQAEKQRESGTFRQEGIADDLGIVGSAAIVPVLEKFSIDRIVDKVPVSVKNKLVSYGLDIGKSALAEGVTEAAESVALSGIEKITTNEEAKLFEGIPDDASMGAVVGGIARAIFLAAVPGNNRAAARSDLDTLDEVMTEVGETKLAGRDPVAMAAFLKNLDMEGELYLPATDAVALYQSEAEFAEAWGLDEAEVMDAIALGGDIAVPASDFIARGSDALMPELRNIVRTAPDRFNEAELANAELQELIDTEFTEDFERQIADTASQLGVNQARSDVQARLEGAGVAPTVAKAQASVWGAMLDTLASKGVDVAAVYDKLSLRIDGPKAAPTPAPTPLSVMVDDIKAGVKVDETEAFGPRLIDIAQERGISDDLGDLADFDVPKGVLREDGGSLRDMAIDAWERGFFEEIPDRAELLEAISEDMAGMGPRIDGGGDPVLASRIETMREVEEAMDAAGLDYASMETADIVAALEEFAGNTGEGGQNVPRGTNGEDGFASDDPRVDGERMAAQGAREVFQSADEAFPDYDPNDPMASAAFREWFGDSKVVDDDGAPLVVYHGTAAAFDKFEVGNVGDNDEGYHGRGLYFTPERDYAVDYAADSARYAEDRDDAKGEIMELFVKTENPYIWDAADDDAATDLADDLASMGFDFDPDDLIDMAGFNFERNDAAKESAKFTEIVKERGHDGVHVYRVDKDGKPQLSEIVAFEPNQIKSVNNRGTFDANDDRILNQSDEGQTPTPDPETARASVTIPADGVLGNGDTVMRLSEAADHTSFLHESAHIFLEIYSELEGQNQDIEAEMEAIRQWLGNEGEVFNRDQHEKFAEGFEAYLFEGTAPNVELRDVFARFKAWFTRVYSSLSNMRIKLDPDSRAIFDRMLATEREIDAARAADTFEVPEALVDLMEPDTAERYRKDVESARNEASERVLNITLKELNKAGRADRRKFRKAIRDEVTADVADRPVYRAFLALSDPDGPKLDKAEIERLVGTSVIKKLMRGKSSVYAGPRRLTHEEAVQAYGKDYRNTFTSKSQKYAYAPGGVHPDTIALQYGYASGEALIFALAGEPKLSEAVKTEIERRVEQEYGKPEKDGTLEKLALEAVRNDPQARVLQAEQAVLARKALQRPMPLAQIKAVAKAFVDDAPSRAVIKPGLNAHYSNLAAKRALRHASQGKWMDALRAKQQQQLNHELARLGWKAQAEVKAIQKYLKRYGPRSKIDPKRMGAEYIGIVRELSTLPGSDDQAGIRDGLVAFMEKSAAEGLPIVLPMSLMSGVDIPSIEEMSLNQLRDYRDAIKSVVFQGRKASDEAKEARRVRAEADSAIIRGTWGGKPTKEYERGIRTIAQKAGDVGRALDSVILRYPFLIEALQGGKTGELMTDLETKLRLKLTERNQKRTEMDQAFFDIMEKHGIDRKELQTKVMVKEISGVAVTFEQVFSLALNMGTVQGADRIASDPSTAEDPASIRDMLDRKMEKRHWDAAQEVWDLLGTLWPESQAVEKRMTGVVPKGVEAIPVETKYGTYKGGYYPIAYDHAAIDNKKIAEQSQEDAWAALTAGVVTRAKTPQGHLIERQKHVSRPVNLKLDVALRHIDDATNDIYMREVATDVNTRLRHPIFERAVAETHGKEYLKTLETVLKRTVAGTERAQGPLDNTIRTLRVNASMAILGFKVTTAALAPVSYFQTVIPQYGKKIVISGLSEFFGGGPKGAREKIAMINEKSAFMNERNKNLVREAHEMVRKSQAASKWDKFRASGFGMMVGVEKYTVSGPVWLGVYGDALERGVPEAEAITEADRAVATTQGSGLEIDQSILQGDRELYRSFTFMWGYMSGYYGTVRNDIQSEAGAKKILPIMKHFILLNVMAAVVETIVRGEFGDEDDPYYQEVLKRMQRNSLGLTPFGMMFNRYGSQTSAADIAEDTAALGTRYQGMADDLISDGHIEGEAAAKAGRDTAKLLGFAFGVPGTVQLDQIIKTLTVDDDPTVFEALVSGPDKDN